MVFFGISKFSLIWGDSGRYVITLNIRNLSSTNVKLRTKYMREADFETNGKLRKPFKQLYRQNTCTPL